MNKDIIKALNKIDTRLSKIEDSLSELTHNYNTTKNTITQVNKSVRKELTDLKTKMSMIVQEKLIEQVKLI